MPYTSEAIKSYLLNLQKQLQQSLQVYESKPFQEDAWQRESGGYGKSCILQEGKVFEGAGVNFSHVFGELPAAATIKQPELAGRPFEAMGISSVIHPCNPFVPTTHMNVRFFIVSPLKGSPIWWFGGGFDLSPYYPFEEDVRHWHQTAKAACTPFGDTVYACYKARADEYFYLPHRKEPRGVGGLFFDDLNTQPWGWNFEKCFSFLRSVGDHFWQAYGPIVSARYEQPFTARERDFQLYRRGRYVEFNLVYDRGTLFGLQFGGRIESILMSLPPQVAWKYDWHPEIGSPEAVLYEKYLVTKDWVG